MKHKLGRAWHYGSWAVTLTLLLGWILFLRPESLGGDATYVVVRGNSMLPTYHTGDLVIVRASSTYEVGDAIAYRVPAGETASGTIVIHRIVGGDAAHGWVIQGDNNESQDPWNPHIEDVVGRAALHLPAVGRVTTLMHDPVMLGGLAAGLTVMWIVARPPSKKKKEPESTDPEPDSTDAQLARSTNWRDWRAVLRVPALGRPPQSPS